jgi:hypothetical protein
MPGNEDRDITRDRKAFTAAIRARVFAFLHACLGSDWEEAQVTLSGTVGEARPDDGEGLGWTPDRLKTAFADYRATHDGPRLDPEGRNQRHTYVQPKPDDPGVLLVQQMLIDAEELNDWVLELEVDLGASREAKVAVLRMIGLGAYGSR